MFEEENLVETMAFYEYQLYSTVVSCINFFSSALYLQAKCCISYLYTGKGKAFPLQALTGPRGVPGG
jgi:hypothetical protein